LVWYFGCITDTEGHISFLGFILPTMFNLLICTYLIKASHRLSSNPLSVLTASPLKGLDTKIWRVVCQFNNQCG